MYQKKLKARFSELKKLNYVSPKIVVKSNEKLGKDKIATWSMPAGTTCIGAGNCLKQSFCYAMNNNFLNMPFLLFSLILV